jgi:serine/threonine protein kinase
LLRGEERLQYSTIVFVPLRWVDPGGFQSRNSNLQLVKPGCMAISLDDFIRSLTETGILSPEEVTSIVKGLPADRNGVDVERLAKELVKQQKLTRFQASVIFKGQSRGLRIGDYIVLDKIGSGGMGQVFKAEDRRTKKQVALKLLRATFTSSERAVKRFYREANTAARLKHRNLVSVSEAGEWNGLHYLVMEMINGRDVRSVVKEKGQLSVQASLDIVLQAARGLAYAHDNGIIHRDIKPANLLLDRTGRVVVLDLGLARLDETAQEAAGGDQGRLTMPGHFLGTLDFVAPEQAADAHEVDGRSDVYSLACTLYYLLKGTPPYRRDNPALILLAHLQDPIPDLTTISGVTPRLNAVFQRMIAKKNYDRFATMSDLVRELEFCQREMAGQKVPPLPPLPANRQETEAPRPTKENVQFEATIDAPESIHPVELFAQPAVETQKVLEESQGVSQGGMNDSSLEFGTSASDPSFESFVDKMPDQPMPLPPLHNPKGKHFWWAMAGGGLTALAVVVWLVWMLKR